VNDVVQAQLPVRFAALRCTNNALGQGKREKEPIKCEQNPFCSHSARFCVGFPKQVFLLEQNSQRPAAHTHTHTHTLSLSHLFFSTARDADTRNRRHQCARLCPFDWLVGQSVLPFNRFSVAF
jgi:hypothetical protein